jgi:hypothetical protein
VSSPSEGIEEVGSKAAGFDEINTSDKTSTRMSIHHITSHHTTSQTVHKETQMKQKYIKEHKETQRNTKEHKVETKYYTSSTVHGASKNSQ